MTHSPKSILLLGAGELGQQVLKHLAAHPEIQSGRASLSLLVRPNTLASTDPSKKAELESYKALNVSLVPGDVTSDVDVLTDVFKQYDTVVSCTGFTGGAGTQLKLARAIIQAETVKRYIPWQFGVDYDIIGPHAANGLFSEQVEVRELLRKNEGKVEWVIVSTGMFMSFLFESYFGVVERWGEGGKQLTVRYLGNWDTKVTVTTVEDIGNLTAHILFDPSVKNEPVFIASDTISYLQLWEALSVIPGLEVNKSADEWTLDFLCSELEKAPEDGLAKYRVAFGEGKGVAWDLDKTYNARNGIATQSLKEWARKNI